MGPTSDDRLIHDLVTLVFLPNHVEQINLGCEYRCLFVLRSTGDFELPARVGCDDIVYRVTEVHRKLISVGFRKVAVKTRQVDHYTIGIDFSLYLIKN